MTKVCIAGFAAIAFMGCGPAATPGGGTITIGTPVMGTLGFTSSQSVIPGRSSTTQYRADIWTVALTMGQPVTILMCRTGNVSFDPYVSITGPMGAMDDVHTNDDGAGSLNSLLVFTPMETGNYTLYATTFSSFDSGSSAGSYTLSVMNGEMNGISCP